MRQSESKPNPEKGK